MIENVKESIERAKLIARAAHLGQKDKGGVPRLEHVLYVGDQFENPVQKIVGYLHDTLEDSPLTSRGRIAALFGWTVADAVDAITRRAGEDYFDYIGRVSENPIACTVKIEDIKHNMDRSRWPEMPDSYYDREVKALRLLQQA